MTLDKINYKTKIFKQTNNPILKLYKFSYFSNKVVSIAVI